MDDVHAEVTMTKQQVADYLLWPLWRCVDESYKDRYKREIWDHFENAIRSAAYTSKLSTFLSMFRQRLPVNLEAQYSEHIRSIVESGFDNDILNWMRDETTYMALLVRLKNQGRKENFKLGE